MLQYYRDSVSFADNTPSFDLSQLTPSDNTPSFDACITVPDRALSSPIPTVLLNAPPLLPAHPVSILIYYPIHPALFRSEAKTYSFRSPSVPTDLHVPFLLSPKSHYDLSRTAL